MNWKNLIISTVIVGAVSTAGYFVYTKKTAEAKEAAQKNSYRVVKKDIKEQLTISGSVAAEEYAVVRFQTSGMLSWIGIKIGDTVKKHQAIASLDKRGIQKQLEKDLLLYKKTRWNFEQFKDDNGAPPYNGPTQVYRDKLKRLQEIEQMNLDSSVLTVEIQHLALDFATMTAPINGIVTRIDSPIAGVNITPATAEVEIINPSTLYLSILADQTEVVKLSLGTPVSVLLDPFPDSPLTGMISSIAFTPKSGESGTVYEVKIALPIAPPMQSALRIGMTGDATITLREKPSVLSIPLSYIKTEKEQKYVWKKQEKDMIKAYVTTGIETDAEIEIVGGLADGDIIYD